MVARALTTKVYFDGGCRPNPGSMSIALVVRGAARIVENIGEGSSGDAEWLALLAAMEAAIAAGERDIVLLGDSVSVLAQAGGQARFRGPPDAEARFVDLSAHFDRVRFRSIKRNQNLAGIALDRVRQRSVPI